MTEQGSLEKLTWAVATLVLLAMVYHFLNYFRNPTFLAGIILFEVILFSLWHYELVYLPLTMVVFVSAGTATPLIGYMGAARWLVLAVGAMSGATLWMRGREQSFKTIHLAALFAWMAALVSAVVSRDPMSALLKVLSVFLLFLYGATGARLAIAGRQWSFMKGLQRTCEITVFLTALAYAVGWQVWGNPNSLGAVMGVGMMPVLLWGFMTAKSRSEKHRSLAAVLTCVVLLYISLSRASIFAASAAVIVLCICARRQRLLIEGLFMAALVIGVAGVLEPDHFNQAATNFTSEMLYKGKTEQGIFSSRQTPWDETKASLEKHPWLGTGWGTSDFGGNAKVATISLTGGIYTLEGTNREHGNSYLAIAEYVGMVGIIPFAFLLFLVLRMVLQVCLWIRQTSSIAHPAVPIAIFILAGLVHAFFEDWMVAPGSYLCVFFWTNVFLLNDLMPGSRPFHLPKASPSHPELAPSPAFR